MANRVSIEDEVLSFLSVNKNNYKLALDEFKGIFVSYQKSAEGKQLIYRVASRYDYQYGEELKKEDSLVNKIKERRKNNSNYTIDRVEDIIGIKLVCIHPNDVEALKKYILKSEKLTVLSDEKHNDEKGYKAIHVIATLKNPSSIVLKNIKCEIQIVTMLQEAWGFKTHGPVYKRRKYLSEEHKSHFKYLSDYLDVVDQQTEFVLKEIKRKRALEEQRRFAIIEDHLIELLSKVTNFNGGDESKTAMKLLIGDVKETITGKCKYMADNYMDKDINRSLDIIMGKVKDYENEYKIFENPDKFSLCENILHIVTLVEALEITGKFSNESLNYADKLLRHCVDGSKNKVRAHLHKGLILYCFGDFEKARKEAEKALDVANSLNNSDDINDAKNNYGYFSVECVDNNRKDMESGKVKKIKEKVFQYLDEAIENATNPYKKDKYRDSLAFAYIVFGSTENEIEDGIKLCKSVLEPVHDNLFVRYNKKHLRRAHERMLEII